MMVGTRADQVQRYSSSQSQNWLTLKRWGTTTEPPLISVGTKVTHSALMWYSGSTSSERSAGVRLVRIDGIPCVRKYAAVGVHGPLGLARAAGGVDQQRRILGSGNRQRGVWSWSMELRTSSLEQDSSPLPAPRSFVRDDCPNRPPTQFLGTPPPIAQRLVQQRAVSSETKTTLASQWSSV